MKFFSISTTSPLWLMSDDGDHCITIFFLTHNSFCFFALSVVVLGFLATGTAYRVVTGMVWAKGGYTVHAFLHFVST
jgi:hypothetical protein